MNDTSTSTDLGNITMAALKQEKLQESLSGLEPVRKIAIVKAAPINYATEAWKQLSPVFANISFAVIADTVERVSGWTFSPWVWDVIIASVSVGCALLLLNFVLMIHRRKRNNDTVTQMLIKANDLPDATVELIDCDPGVISAYTAAGYKIVPR